MSRFFLAAVALTAAASLPAQGLSIETSTEYGVVADDGTTRNGDVEAAGTAVGPRGLRVSARSGALRSGQRASASTTVSGFTSRTGVEGLRVQENGFATGAGSSAGTIAGRPAMARRAPHGLDATWQVRPNATGTLTVSWQSNARGNANANAAVDVDGDGTPDFTGRSGMSDTQQFNVTADANGDVSIAIATAGAADADAMNGAFYSSSLTIAFRPDTTGGGTRCTFMNFGTACTGTLSGREIPRTTINDVALTVAGAPADAFGLMLIGTQQMATPLPGSTCELLVDPMGTVPFRVDANGDGGVRIPLRVGPMGLNVDAQAVFVSFSSTGLQLGSTDGLNIQCQ